MYLNLRAPVTFMLMAWTGFVFAESTSIEIELRHSATPYRCYASQCYAGEIEKRIEDSEKDVRAICAGPFAKDFCEQRKENLAAARQCASICSAKARCKQVLIIGGDRRCTTAYFF
jgi:hypothetical protein